MNDLRRWGALVLALALVALPLAGCATKTAEPVDIDDTVAAGDPADGPMAELAESATLRGNEREFLAGATLKQADAFYERGEFAKAREAYATVLELVPDNDDAKAKLANVARLLGERGGELEDAFRDVRSRRLVKIQQARVQIEALWNKGLLAQKDGRFGAAIKSFESAALIEDLFEYDVDFTPNKAGLKKQIELARTQNDEAMKAGAARAIAEANKVKEAEALREKKERLAKIAMLFRDANKAFDYERYAQVENFADAVLRIDPRSKAAIKLKDLASCSRLAANNDMLRRRNAEEWKCTFEAFNRSVMPMVRDVMFPADWVAR
jgi:tetratricopeptide (TPR) repeat protein